MFFDESFIIILFIIQTSYRDYLHIRDISNISMIFFFLHLTQATFSYIFSTTSSPTKKVTETETKVPPTAETEQLVARILPVNHPRACIHKRPIIQLINEHDFY